MRSEHAVERPHRLPAAVVQCDSGRYKGQLPPLIGITIGQTPSGRWLKLTVVVHSGRAPAARVAAGIDKV